MQPENENKIEAYLSSDVLRDLFGAGISDRELSAMKFNAEIKVPLKDRIKLLWHGRFLLQVDYRGQNNKKNRLHVAVIKRGENL